MKVKEFKICIDSTIGLERFNYFSIDAIKLQDINLLVGKNASGKSTTLNNLQFMSEILKNRGPGYYVGTYDFKFLDEKNNTFHYIYFASIRNEIRETLTRNGEELINRVNDKARIFSETKNDYEDVNPPQNIPLMVTRRDSKEYPYIEELITWANGVYSFKFGHVHPHYISESREESAFTSSSDFNKYLEGITDEAKETVKNDFNSLGYKVEKITFVKGTQGELLLKITEEGVKHSVDEFALSQGMFRSMWLILYIQYLIEKCNASLIIIDDLCEGLDYSRATALGKLLFKKMKENNVQFVATSNDSFLMNVVDIKYWNILVRNGDTIQSYNYSNSKEKFDKFDLIGLNNFDLFTSDFLR